MEVQLLGIEVILLQFHLQQMELGKMVSPRTKPSREEAITEQKRTAWPNPFTITI